MFLDESPGQLSEQMAISDVGGDKLQGGSIFNGCKAFLPLRRVLNRFGVEDVVAPFPVALFKPAMGKVDTVERSS